MGNNLGTGKTMVDSKNKTSAYNKKSLIQYQHPSEGRKGHIGRRLVHISSSFLIVYFLFPTVVFEIGPFKMYRALLLLLLFLLIPLPIELVRLHKGKVFLMLRETEKGHFAAYIWTLVGAMGLCFLTEIGLPEFIAVPILVSAALGDPLLGEIRIITGFRRRHYYSLSVFVCSVIYFIWLGNPILALAAGFLTVVAESLNVELSWSLRNEMLHDLENRNFLLRGIKKTKVSNSFFRADDNLVMMVVPLLFLLLLYLVFPQIFPPNSFVFGSWPVDILSSHGFGTLFGL